jgi:hypothetical protein
MNYRSLIWLVVLGWVLAACGPATPDAGLSPVATPGLSDEVGTLPEGEVLDQDAEAYASEYDLDLEEARRRLALQDAIGELNAELTDKERATFAGLWVEHTPEFRMIVRFTERGAETLMPYIEGGPLEDIAEVRGADATHEDLRAAHQAAMSAVGKLGISVTSAVDVVGNRVEIHVADRVWFAAQLEYAGIELPDHVELVVVGGLSAKEIDICATPEVPGVAFPRQGPIEGPRAVMQALMIGRLVLVDGCLRVESFHGDESLLAIWPPEFGLAAEGDEIHVLDGAGQVVARVGEEVYMGGGGGSASGLADCVREQLPAACRGPYWIVGDEVRPNLKRDSSLFTLEEIEMPDRSLLLIHKEPVLDGWIESESLTSGKLVLWDYDRCPRIMSEDGLGNYLPLWPPDYAVKMEEGEIAIVDGSGQVVARVGEEVTLGGGPIPHSWDSAEYRRLHGDLPGDCSPPYWIVGD